MKIPGKRRDGLEQGEVEQPQETSRRNSPRGVVDDQIGGVGNRQEASKMNPGFWLDL